MARSSILSDELIRQLVAVGQVDILVGVPTFNHAETIESVVKTLHVGLARAFPRERTVIINPDGGSDDGTVQLVRRAPMAAEELKGLSSLRTTHRVSAPYNGLPGRAAGVRCVLAAAELLQARAVVLIDADVVSMTPGWVEGLARPVWKDEAELVLPIHSQHRLERPLLTQLVRPLVGSVFARRLRSSLSGAFGCSGRLAPRLLGHPMWSEDPMRAGLDVWLLATALAEDLRLTQTHLGPNVLSTHGARVTVHELFEQVVGPTFACLDRYAGAWMPRTEPRDVPEIGQPGEPAGPDPVVEVGPMAERFFAGARDLEQIHREILTPQTLARLLVVANGEGIPKMPDALWVAIVHEFAASAHRGVMNREHLTQALVPLYLGRAASFLVEMAAADDVATTQRMNALQAEFEAQRPEFLERWNEDGRR